MTSSQKTLSCAECNWPFEEGQRAIEVTQTIEFLKSSKSGNIIYKAVNDAENVPVLLHTHCIIAYYEATTYMDIREDIERDLEESLLEKGYECETCRFVTKLEDPHS